MVDVSVIVLGYNGLKYLENCFSSLICQDFPDERYEIIYVDNGSSDDSVQYVKDNFEDIKIVELDNNYGFAEGNNIGLKYAKGDYIVFLNQDTIVHKKWLSSLVDAAKTDDNIGACFSNILSHICPEYNEKSRNIYPEHMIIMDVSPFGYFTTSIKHFNKNPIRTLSVSGCSLLIKRTILDKMDYCFDPDFFIQSEDLDLGLRINSMGYKTLLIPTSIVYHLDYTKENIRLQTTGKKYFIATKNRFIAYYKNTYLSEFLLLLPMLLLGIPFKAKDLDGNFFKKIVYGILSTPIGLYAFILAVLDFHRYGVKRKEILSKRKREKYWFLKKMAAKKRWNNRAASVKSFMRDMR